MLRQLYDFGDLTCEIYKLKIYLYRVVLSEKFKIFHTFFPVLFVVFERVIINCLNYPAIPETQCVQNCKGRKEDWCRTSDLEDPKFESY